MSWRRWLCEYLGKVCICEDTTVNTAWSSWQGNSSTGICLTMGKWGYKFDGILGLHRAASSVEHKPWWTLVKKFCGSGLRTREGTQGGHYIWSMTKTVPTPQAKPSWDDRWSNPLQFASAIKKAYFPTILKPPYVGPIYFLNSNIKLFSSLPLSLKVATAIQNDQSYQLKDPSMHVLRSTLQLPHKATENKWL